MEDNKEHWEVVDEGGIVVSNSPEELWKNATSYFLHCKNNPIINKVVIKSGKEVGKMVKEELTRPYSVRGLCLHCGILEEYLKDIRAGSQENPYYNVVSKILYIIYIQNLELATVGVFNPIFVSKVLNMEKEEVPTNAIKIEIVTGLPELSESENQVLEKLLVENGEVKIITEQ